MRHSRGFVLFLLCAAVLPSALSAYVAPLPQASAPSAQPSRLLIASRKLTHRVFREAVILVTRHADDGHIGIIVNRPLDIPLDQVLPSLPGAEKHVLHRGGPVNPGHISYLFRGGEAEGGSTTVAEQTYFSSSIDLLGALLAGARPHTGLRVVSGYAGWAPQQLAHEIARGDWHMVAVDSAVLFDRPLSTMWPELHRRATLINARIESSGLCDKHVAEMQAAPLFSHRPS